MNYAILMKMGKAIVSIVESKDENDEVIFRAVYRTASRDKNLTIQKKWLRFEI